MMADIRSLMDSRADAPTYVVAMIVCTLTLDIWIWDESIMHVILHSMTKYVLLHVVVDVHEITK